MTRERSTPQTSVKFSCYAVCVSVQGRYLDNEREDPGRIGADTQGSDTEDCRKESHTQKGNGDIVPPQRIRVFGGGRNDTTGEGHQKYP